MTLKKIKILELFMLFGLSVLFHFTYEWIPTLITSILFPVNETIWEHMKLFYSSTLIYSFIDYLLIKKNNIEVNNFLLQVFIRSILSIIIYLLMYLPIKSIFGENMVITISLMFITYIISVYISYKLLNYKQLNVNKNIIILLIFAMYGVFAYFTFNQ